MKRLIVAEKPSVGRTIADHLGAREAHDGWLEGESDVVTWLHGHVVELEEPAHYSSDWGRPWRLDALPMIPDDFDWTASPEPGSAGILSRVCKLIDRPDVGIVVHACDDDREGEGIFRRVLLVHPTSKPVLRLWLNSLEDTALDRALATLRPDSDYDGLGDAAMDRAIADWLVGLNATRACTKAYGRMVHAGRVTSPLLHLVCDRTVAARDFSRVPFWQLEAEFGNGLVLRGERMPSERDASQALAACGEGPVSLCTVERAHRKTNAPALYDLTNLQADSARRHGLTAKQTVDALQALYESRLTTYPRTDSRYVTSDDVDTVVSLLASAGVRAVAGKASVAFDSCASDVTRVVCDDKVSGHTAVLPTTLVDSAKAEALPPDQRAVLNLVCVRLLAATCEPSEADVVKVTGTLGGHDLSGSATHETHAGWKAVERALSDRDGSEGGARDVIVGPEFAPRALVDANVRVARGETKPPKPYTEDSLLEAMAHADKLVDDARLKAALRDSSSHSGGLGAPSSRAQAIEELVTRGYVERVGKSKNKTLVATEEGLAVDACIPLDLRSVELTASWEEQLSDVEHGRESLSSFIGYAKGFARGLVSEVRASYDPALSARGKTYGTCPRCGQPVIKARSGKLFYCSSRRGHLDPSTNGWVTDDEGCGFRIYPDQTTGRDGSKRKDPYRLTDSQVTALLAGKPVKAGGRTRVLDETWGVTTANAPQGGPRRRKGTR